MIRPRATGLAMAVAAGALYGVSGVAAQVLMDRHRIPPAGLAGIRMLSAGVILLAWLRPRFPRADWRSLLLLAIVGQAGMQVTYFAAIQASNVATGTFLGALSLPMLTAWDVISGRARATPAWWCGMAATALGASLLLLGGGGLDGLRSAGPVAIAWGLSSAVLAAYYVVASRRLVAREIGVWRINAYSLALGGVALQVIHPFWTVPATSFSPGALGLLALMVAFGTILASACFVGSVRLISAAEAGAAVTSQPVVAAVAGVVLLGISMAPVQYLGGLLVVGGIVALSLAGTVPRNRAAAPELEAVPVGGVR